MELEPISQIGNGCARLWRAAGKARQRSIAQRSVTEEQCRQTPARASPKGLPIFAAAAALLVGQRSMKDILPPRALPHKSLATQPFPIYEMGLVLASTFSNFSLEMVNTKQRRLTAKR